MGEVLEIDINTNLNYKMNAFTHFTYEVTKFKYLCSNFKGKGTLLTNFCFYSATSEFN